MNILKGALSKTTDALKTVRDSTVQLADDQLCASHPKCNFKCTKAFSSTYYTKCVLCQREFCKKCIHVIKNTNEDVFLPEGAKNRMEGKFVCKEHRKEVQQQLIEKFRVFQAEALLEALSTYLSNGEKQQLLFPKPAPKEDGTMDKVSRVTDVFKLVAGLGMKMLGADMVYKVAVQIYEQKGIISLLMNPDTFKLINPIVSSLLEDAKRSELQEEMKEREEKGKEGKKGGGSSKASSVYSETYWNLVYTYYLSIVHKQQSRNIHDSLSASDEGMVAVKAPVELIDYVGQFMPYAQWLYTSSSSLHRPEALNWYLSKITQAKGWTILTAKNSSTSFIDGYANPAFAIAARSGPEGKEVIISIRGSSENTDWCINVQESPLKFELEGVSGYIHRGMYHGVISILDYFGTRQQLTELVQRGYGVTVVGHSLGAGSCMLLAAEFLNHLRRENIANAEEKVRAIGFATPAVTTENLAVKMSELGWVTVIYNNDIVPRISRCNMKALTKEIKEFTPTAKRWYDADYASLQKVLKDVGRRDDSVILEAASNPSSPSTSTSASSTPSAAVVVTATATASLTSSSSSPILLTPAATSSSSSSSASAAPTTTDSDDNNDNDNDDVTQEEEDMGDKAVLVPPGRLLYIYKSGPSQKYLASEITHKHASIRCVRLVVDEMVNDHLMVNYWSAVRGVRYLYGVPSQIHEENNNNLKLDFTKHIYCAVCEIDTTWPYRFHGEASRYDCTKICAICSRTVCVVCAPAGDIIPEEGITDQTRKLPTTCITAPARGYMSKQRVCIHCYLNSYETL